MTKQRNCQRLIEAGEDRRAEFEIDQQVSAAKEQRGLGGLREQIWARSLVERLGALMTPTNEGYITLCWKDGLVGCSMANGVSLGATAGAKSIPAALDQALLDMTEMGF